MTNSDQCNVSAGDPSSFSLKLDPLASVFPCHSHEDTVAGEVTRW